MAAIVPVGSGSARRVVGLFAKQPLPGLVKTRLAAATSAAWAARVAEAFLLDTLAKLAGLDAERVVAFAPHAAQAYFVNIAAGRFELMPQMEGDLGQRLASFCTAHLQRGVAAVVLVGTDSPTLPLGYIEQAFRALEQADVVVGPATDGGYYLIGCARRLPPIFEGVAWSSSRVLAQTIACLTNADGRLAVLPPWYDVDTLDDWWLLQGHVAALRRAGLDPCVPHTEPLLACQTL